MASFQWQGKDFGAWLTTIARNLIVDHFKSSRTRLETSTDDFSDRRETSDSPEAEVLAALTNEVLREAMAQLAPEQQECIILRFLNGYSIAETAKSLGRSEGAIKQLQLRAVRNLAKLVPRDIA
jgi:RNA polymerase sigma-70 factor (ECF subfamily)